MLGKFKSICLNRVHVKDEIKPCRFLMSFRSKNFVKGPDSMLYQASKPAYQIVIKRRNGPQWAKIQSYSTPLFLRLMKVSYDPECSHIVHSLKAHHADGIGDAWNQRPEDKELFHRSSPLWNWSRDVPDQSRSYLQFHGLYLQKKIVTVQI